MTRDHARKKAIRARMDATGEPYSAAARKIGTAGGADDLAAASELIIACVNNTLAARRATIAVRADWDSKWGLWRAPWHRPGRVERLATLAAKTAVRRMPFQPDLAGVGDRFKQAMFHPAGEGFIEPAAERYQIAFGGQATMEVNGQHYRGRPGTPLEEVKRLNEEPVVPGELLFRPLLLLRTLRDVTDVRPIGQETVRGTPCQVIAVRAGSAELTVWVDGDHIRRVRSEEGGSSERVDISLTKTLELWDFGPVDAAADWTHLPSAWTAMSASAAEA